VLDAAHGSLSQSRRDSAKQANPHRTASNNILAASNMCSPTLNLFYLSILATGNMCSPILHVLFQHMKLPCQSLVW